MTTEKSVSKCWKKINDCKHYHDGGSHFEYRTIAKQVLVCFPDTQILIIIKKIIVQFEEIGKASKNQQKQ